MDPLIPEWLDNAFLSDCLRNESNNQNLTVTDFKAKSAVPPGNNYGSIVIRVSLNYKDESRTEIEHFSKNVIIKLPLTQGAIKEAYGESLDVEPIFYKDYLPKASEVLSGEYAPKYYPSSSNKIVVVLEDLNESGYVMADRIDKLNLDNCLRYAEAAAAFHGGSIAVFEKHSEMVKTMCTEKLLSYEIRAAKPAENITRYGLNLMAERVLKYTGDERISNLIQKSSSIVWDLLVECVKPTGEFDTINQGDPWLTNMMFRYDDLGNCVGMKILDYQALRYASPATDLVFFLWTSSKHYVREEKYEQFVQTYLEAMNRNLEEMNCDKRLSLEHLKKELLRMSPIAIYIASSVLPFMEVAEGANGERLFTQCEQEYSPEKNPYEEFFTDDFCKKHLARLVNQLNKLGVLKYLEEHLQKLK